MNDIIENGDLSFFKKRRVIENTFILLINNFFKYWNLTSYFYKIHKKKKLGWHIYNYLFGFI